jgi:hypothetical protein
MKPHTPLWTLCRLGRLVEQALAVGYGGQPADAEVAALWAKAESVVRDCLALAGGPAPQRREGFWK